jgi:hypothetical protein
MRVFGFEDINNFGIYQITLSSDTNINLAELRLLNLPNAFKGN